MSVPVRHVNQFANPSFEDGTTGWTFTNATRIAQGRLGGGTYCAYINSISAGFVSQTINSAQLLAVRYYWSIWVRHAGGTTGQLNLAFTSSNLAITQAIFLKRTPYTVIAEYYPTGGAFPVVTTTFPTSTWQLLSLSFEALPSTTNLTLEAKHHVAGSDWLLDDASFLVPDYTIYVGPPPPDAVPTLEPTYVRQGHPPGRGRVYTDAVLGSSHREGQVGRDRYGRLRRVDDLDDPARDDYPAPTSRESEEPEP